MIEEGQKQSAPNLRRVQACNNCRYSHSFAKVVRRGGTCVGCTKYEEVISSDNHYVCDDYKDMEEE